MSGSWSVYELVDWTKYFLFKKKKKGTQISNSSCKEAAKILLNSKLICALQIKSE